MKRPKKAVSILLVLTLSVFLVACTVELAPQTITTQQVLTRFEPDRGSGASYRSGDTIAFRLNSQQSGYLTLVVIDPDGQAYVLARNLRIGRGQSLISGVGGNTQFVLVPPTGQHRVRAYFTPQPYRGTIDRSRQVSVLAPANATDALETHFTLLR